MRNNEAPGGRNEAGMKIGFSPSHAALSLALLAGGSGVAVAQNPGSRSASLHAVETGVTAFVGVVPNDAVPRGGGRPAPAGRPVQVRSWDEFATRFADFGPPPSRWTAEDAAAHRYLQLAVRGFFANGGRRAWVLRVPASSDLTDLRGELNALRQIDADLIAVPGATGRAQQEAILAHVGSVGDRFALLDGRPDPPREVPADVRATGRNSDRATLLFPWILVRDPVSGRTVPQPPSGHVAGAISRSDRERGVHRAPANLSLADASSPERSLSRSAMDPLTLDGVLVMRTAAGSSGVGTWGARTLGGDANGAFRYISVRRIVDQVEETLRRELSSATCADAVGPAETFLQGLWRSGVLQGARPSDAFFVRCQIQGEVLLVGVSALRPAEFITLRVDVGR